MTCLANPSSSSAKGISYKEGMLMFSITFCVFTLQKRDNFCLISTPIGLSQRQTNMSGWIPMLRSSFTLNWAGFVFNSSAGMMMGIKAT